MKNPFLIISIVVLGTYVLVGLTMYVIQRSYIYFPDNQDFFDCPGFADSEKINIRGTRAYFNKVSDNLIVFYHGNAGSACDRAYLKYQFQQWGYSSLFVEYAGYSNDSRQPSQNLLLNDAKNINDFLQKQSFPHIVLMGESLGTALVAYHSSLRFVDGLVLIAPFDSLTSVGQAHYKFLPVGLFLKDTYPTANWINQNPTRTLIIRGAKDNIIPLASSEKLFKSLVATDKDFIVIPTAEHNDIYDFEEIFKNIEKFLEKT